MACTLALVADVRQERGHFLLLFTGQSQKRQTRVSTVITV